MFARKNERVKRKIVVNIRTRLPPRTSARINDEQQFIDDIDDLCIDEFTSRDFAHDLDSCYETQEQMLKDHEYVATWHSAICSNPHLFKDKVR